MKKWIIPTVILALILLIILNWRNEDYYLGDNYYYLPKYEAEDIGYPESIIYKSDDRSVFSDIKIGGDVVRAPANKDFILAIQDPVQDIHGESSDTGKYHKYFIIDKKTDKVHGPYTVGEYLQKRQELRVPHELNLGKQ